MLNITTFINWFLQIFNNLGSSLNQNKSQLGYSAEIWHRASTEVYKTIGDSKNLQLSPPNHANSIHLNGDHGLKLGYFNLHGIKDGPDWYGQKDFSSFSNGPDYPVALTPTMFDENNSAPKLVLTEACYGAHIIDKQCEEAISLKVSGYGHTNLCRINLYFLWLRDTPIDCCRFVSQYILEGKSLKACPQGMH